MLASYPPFWDEDQVKTYNKILECNIRFPAHFSGAAKELILGLLERRHTRRLGVGVNGVENLRNSAWFSTFDWDGLEKRTLAAPAYLTPKDPNSLVVEPIDRNPAMMYVDYGDNWDADFGPLVGDDVAQ